MGVSLRSLWRAPPPPDLPPVGRGDLLWTAVALALVAVEVRLRPELSWSSTGVLLGVGPLVTLVWRRRHPLPMVLLAFGVTITFDVLRARTGAPIETLNAAVFMLMLPYALHRWGAGRARVLGTPVMLFAATAGVFVDPAAGVQEAVGGFGVLTAAMALGAAARASASARLREVAQVKAEERARLARDLHDTVAHHVCTIAIRAQAGQAVAATDPSGATEALKVIENEAKESLRQMRAMVGSLREQAALSPLPGMAALQALAEGDEAPPVQLSIQGETEGLPEPTTTTLFRIAQESITNARRHARRATRIFVAVKAEARQVELRVSDDGAPSSPRGRGGFGLAGMRERAEQLGGTCEAGPDPVRGWTVVAVLPTGAPNS